jgi:hypothetical protein
LHVTSTVDKYNVKNRMAIKDAHTAKRILMEIVSAPDTYTEKIRHKEVIIQSAHTDDGIA